MSSEQDMDADPVRQAQIAQMQIFNQLLMSLTQMLGPRAPAIIPGALYVRGQMEGNLGTGTTTTAFWIEQGLKVYRPATRSDLFLGDDVIQFIKNNPELKRPENYKPSMK